jgi:hypothetical protein
MLIEGAGMAQAGALGYDAGFTICSGDPVDG